MFPRRLGRPRARATNPPIVRFGPPLFKGRSERFRKGKFSLSQGGGLVFFNEGGSLLVSPYDFRVPPSCLPSVASARLPDLPAKSSRGQAGLLGFCPPHCQERRSRSARQTPVFRFLLAPRRRTWRKDGNGCFKNGRKCFRKGLSKK